MSFVSFRAYPGVSGIAPFAQPHVKSHKSFTNGPGFHSSVPRISFSKMASQSQKFNGAQIKRLNFTQFQTFSKDRPFPAYRSLIQAESLRRSHNVFNNLPVAASNDASFNSLLLLLGILTALSMMDEVHADDFSDGEWERIYLLLDKSYLARSIDEKIELFNYLLREGEKSAIEAKDKDIVIYIGNTSAGKSTLINYLYGCTMKEEDGMVVVDPNSKKKEVAIIGTTVDSCTFIPKKIPDVTVKIPEGLSTMEDMI